MDLPAIKSLRNGQEQGADHRNAASFNHGDGAAELAVEQDRSHQSSGPANKQDRQERRREWHTGARCELQRVEQKERARRIDELLVLVEEQVRVDAVVAAMECELAHLHVQRRVAACGRRKPLGHDGQRRRVRVLAVLEKKNDCGKYDHRCERQQTIRSGVPSALPHAEF